MSENLAVLERIAAKAKLLVDDPEVPAALKPRDGFSVMLSEVAGFREWHDTQTRSDPFYFSVRELDVFVRTKILDPLSALVKAKATRGTDGKLHYDQLPPALARFAIDAAKAIETRREARQACAMPTLVTKDRFGRLAGLAAEKAEITKAFILPQLYPGLWKNFAKGLLMVGPPGTGKTALARAACGELNGRIEGARAAFRAVSGKELKSRFHGGTESQFAEVFSCALQAVEDPDSDSGPRYGLSILFLDEVDDIAADRTGAEEVTRLTTNSLLREMDGFSSSPKVAVMAATNLPWLLDEGFLRRVPSRVFVDLPDRMARLGIIVQSLIDNYCPDEFKGPREVVWEPDTPSDISEVKPVHAGDAVAATFKRIEEAGGVVTDTGDRAGPLTFFDVKKFVVPLTGPQHNRIMSHRPAEEMDHAGVYPLGYTGSDVVAMMNQAASAASARILTSSTVYFVEFDGKMEARYGATPPGVKRVGLEEASKAVGRENIVNYVITLADLKAAISTYKSTVNQKNYAKLIDWKNGKPVSKYDTP
jgi:SpoVK/Ycf46/Vps4 family AAA+-type ATPase